MRILLIDDDEAFMGMMAEYLVADGFDCECAHKPLQGLERALSGGFDAVVLDVMMPQLNGMDLLRRLRLTSSVAVLMLTAKGDSVDRVTGLELGADDYLPKPVYPRELTARLRAVLRRTKAEPSFTITDGEIRVGALRIAPARRECWIREQVLTLTGTEFDLLVQLARDLDSVVSKDELSERSLRRKREAYDRSIDVHISNLRQKLAACSGGIEIETIRAIGYRLKVLK